MADLSSAAGDVTRSEAYKEVLRIGPDGTPVVVVHVAVEGVLLEALREERP